MATTSPTIAPSEMKVNLIYGILVSGLMSTVFAGLFPLLALGFTTEWLLAWATGVAIGWPLGYALVTIATPPLRKLAANLATRLA